MTFINSVYQYNVDDSSTVNLLVDTNYVIACYDGTLSSAVRWPNAARLCGADEHSHAAGHSSHYTAGQ